jgi:acetyl-CoA carboxylase, biotin carboxylase subunit
VTADSQTQPGPAPRPVRRVLVANRGEIAVRVIRAAHAFGAEAVAVYSDADRESRWVALADESVHLGSSQAAKSYLDADKVVQAALDTDCDAVHPGYGFLSERPGFARKVSEAGLTFVGPDADVIAKMGDKAAARHAAVEAGVPVVPGSDVVTDVDAARKAATEVGYPVLVKAAAGGGGRGISPVAGEHELEQALTTARREAESAFGDGHVYLEKSLLDARHVEVQVLADAHGNVVHAFERDCSVQRRRQKLLEEAPAPDLADDVRRAMTEAAVALTASVGYRGAGTVEFLVDGDSFYFIEMNTRLQVEHPISEEVTGLDLVVEQLRIASGERISVERGELELEGVALELRVNAEDPEQDFFPSPGKLERFDLPGGPGVRVETGFVAGDVVSPYYDSLLAKIVVWGADREQAFARAGQALDELVVEGVATTANLHRRLLASDDLRAGPVTTRWLENRL